MNSEEVKISEEATANEAGDTTAVGSDAAPNAETQNSATDREEPKSDDGGTDKQKSTDSKMEEKCEDAPSGTEQGVADTIETPTPGETKKQKEASDNNESRQDETAKGDGGEKNDKKEDTETKEREKAVEDSTEKQNGEAEGAVGGADPRNMNGKYSHVKSENLDDFFKAIGVPWLMRKMLKRFNHSTEIVQDGDKFDIKLCTGFMVKEWKFTVGEEFEEKPMGWSNDIMIVQSSWDGDKLVMNSVPKSEKAKSKPIKITRQLNGDDLTMVLEVDNVVCTRSFKRKKN